MSKEKSGEVFGGGAFQAEGELPQGVRQTRRVKRLGSTEEVEVKGVPLIENPEFMKEPEGARNKYLDGLLRDFGIEAKTKGKKEGEKLSAEILNGNKHLLVVYAALTVDEVNSLARMIAEEGFNLLVVAIPGGDRIETLDDEDLEKVGLQRIKGHRLWDGLPKKEKGIPLGENRLKVLVEDRKKKSSW